MAKISVQCPSCSARGSVDEALAGKKIGCPKCGTKFAGGSGAHAALQPIASAAATKTIAFPCPRCKKQITIRADRAGSRIDCPGCSTPVSVPVPRGLRPASQAASPPRSPIPEQPHHREAVSHEPALAASSLKLAASHEETKPEHSASTEEDSVPVDWKPGDVILDLYEVTGVLGEGGMGKVYKVHHRGWNTDLAVKSPRPEILTRPGAMENFERECETWVNLGLHPHIVSCHYVRRLGGSARVFAEYVAGGSLQDWIHGQDGQPAKLYEGGPQAALERMLDIAIQFAWGLHYAHEQGLIHQDVKPANVMMTPDGTAKVTDFGLAKARAAAGEQQASSSALNASPSTLDSHSILVSTGGMTPAYCSPEQANRQPLSRKTDIWSWAASVLEMFTGEVTWPSGSVAGEAIEGYLEVGAGDERIPSMPAGVADLLRRCFERRSQARPDDMHAIAGTLQQIYQAAVGQEYARPEPVTAELLADTLNNRALSLFDLGKAVDAERVWEEALRHDLHHPEATHNVGLVRFRNGRLAEEALLHQLQEVWSSQPDRWHAEFLLAQACVSLGRAERATKLAEELERTAQADAIEASRRLRQQLAGFGRCLRTFEGHTAGVGSVCLSGDGRYTLSGSVVMTIRFGSGSLARAATSGPSRDTRPRSARSV